MIQNLSVELDQSVGDPARQVEREPPRIAVENVTRVFIDGSRTVPALGPIDLQVAEGSFVCIVGPSGCGKSTLLRILGGLINPSAGRVRLNHANRDAVLYSMVFQDHSVFPWKTVRNNVRFALDVQGRVPRRERNGHVDYWLEQLGLADFADAYPRTLSGGMRQRVSIARALVVEPEILLMDEPFAALDAQLRLILQLELIRLWEAHRRTVVFITHALDEAILLGDRVVVLTSRPGQIVADVRVPFPRPRDFALRATPQFAALQHDVWEVLRQQVQTPGGGASPAGGRVTGRRDDHGR